MKTFEYRAPASLAEALSELKERGDEAKVIAGGTALVIMMKQQLVQPGYLINVQGARDLAGIREDGDGLRIGALTTHYEVETSPLVRKHLPALAETFRKVATVRIRNVATVGGNLAHGDPNLDPPAMFVALDARVRLASADGGERVVPLDEFFTDYYETALKPEELLTEVQVPYLAPLTAAVYLKFLPRSQDDYATVGVAARLTLNETGDTCDDVRIALSAAGSTIIRAREAEATLRGQPATDEAFRASAAAVLSEVDPLADIRGTAEYKRDMAEVFVRRALEAARRELTEHGRRNGAQGTHA